MGWCCASQAKRSRDRSGLELPDSTTFSLISTAIRESSNTIRAAAIIHSAVGGGVPTEQVSTPKSVSRR